MKWPDITNEDKRNNFKIAIFIAILSTIPLFFIWGKLAIGGDTMIPTNSASLEKYLFQWMGTQNGQYFSINYYPLYVFYKFSEFFRPNIYFLSSLLVFLLNFTAGYGIYRLVKLFSTKNILSLYIVPILFYLFSPALLNGWHYLYIYSAAPWFFYFIFKWIKSRRIEVADIFWINIVIFFSSLDLPNPKYLFHFFLIAAISICLSVILKLIRLDFFIKNALKLAIIVISFAYLTLPLSYFATHYTPEAYGVHIKKGYKDKGSLPDYGSATIDRMMSLHHHGLNLNLNKSHVYAANDLITFLSYVFIIVIVFMFFSQKRRLETSRYTIIFLSIIVAYLFFASGSNPPFGTLYESLVEKFSVLAFLRTTAGAVFYLSLFYALALFVFLESLIFFRKTVTFVLILSILIVGYPFLNGEFYQNNSATNQYANADAHGIKIPDEYFRIKEVLDKNQLDAKVLYDKVGSSYISTQWGYFGPPLFYFIFNDSIVSFDKIYSSIYFHNVGFAINDDSLIELSSNAYQQNLAGLGQIAKENFLTLSAVNTDKFLPHLYVPKKAVISRKNIEQVSKAVSQDTSDESLAIFTKGNSSNDATFKGLEDGAIGSSHVEFKKIDLTKYRVLFHGAQGKFPLVFSEGFHPGWMMYLMPRDDTGESLSEILSQYKILDGNGQAQASTDELAEYLHKGWVTTLGSGKEKYIAHKKWENNKEVTDYEERYAIDFISKNFHDSIQNDNLRDGRFLETWFRQSLDDSVNHVVVNGYANAWVLDTDSICGRSASFTKNGAVCVKNQDGTYDFEVVVEFWPQRLSYAGWLISGAILTVCLAYVVFFKKSRKKKSVSVTESKNTARMV